MGTENSIGYLEAEALVAVMRDADARDQDRPVLRLFQRKSHRAGRIAIRRRFRRPGQVYHTSMGGQSAPIRTGAWTEQYYEPTHIKLHADLTSEDVNLFQDADSAHPRGEVMEEANARIMELAMDLREDDAEERNRMCLGALRDAVTYRPIGSAADITVDYSLSTLTSPKTTTAWSAAGATIVEDMLGFVKEYRDNNTKALPPTHVMYNPDMYQTCFVNNTQWLTFKGNDQGLSRGFLGIAGGTREADNLGNLDPLWGLTWVPISGKYVDLDGTVQDRWPEDRLSFFRLDDGGMPLFQWGMVRDQFHNPSADYNVELAVPQYGQAVKTARATLFDNGLPVITDPQMVQHVEIF